MGGTVRRAGAQDTEALLALWLEMTRHHQSLDPYFRLRPGAESEARRLLAAQLVDPDVGAFVSEDGEITGMCLARVDRAPPIQDELVRGEITDVAVRPSGRRRGVGAALVAEALDWLAARGVARIEVRVAHGNPEGQAFWRALGFGDFMDVLHRRL